jgi:hypothetical protein
MLFNRRGWLREKSKIKPLPGLNFRFFLMI